MKYGSPARLLLIIFSLLLPLSLTQAQDDEAPTFRNPLNVTGGADPWLTYYEGNYYLATTTWRSDLTMWMSPTLAGLKTAEPVQIYYETDPSRCCNMWAPEFHLLDGPNGPRWYFYYTAGTAGPTDNQHLHVLESEGTDPMGPYTYKARLFDPQSDTWAIDGSILELNNALYFLYSAWIGANQSILIAPMENPWTFSGGGVVISQPEYDWEVMGLNINEAPVALHHDDDTFIVYSASFCATPEYKLGMLTYNGGDPLDASSWDKHPEPVFEQSSENGVFGPGHHGFFQSPDGTEDWIVYHANDSLSGACDGRRTTRAQPFTWNEDGTPNFGVPVSAEQAIPVPSGDTGIDPIPEFEPLVLTRFNVYGLPDAYLRHRNFTVQFDYNPNPLADSQFVLVPGLADPEAISIESANFPGYFLRHQGNALYLSTDDQGETFAGDATWWIRPGLADETWISIESYNQPESYIGKMFNVPALLPLTNLQTNLARSDATFREEQS